MDGRRRPHAIGRAGGLALDYPRPGLSAVDPLPAGWRSVSEEAAVGHGVEIFDRLAGRLLDLDTHRRAGMGCTRPDPQAPAVLEVREGPLRGPCRLVETIDESLEQGVVIGTGVGNRAVAEHRCVLRFDPEGGGVTATLRTVWRPNAEHVLPGGAEREARTHRRLLGRLADELVRAAG